MGTVRGIAVAATLVAASIVQPAFAQNVGSNAGIWWTPAPGQPSAFTFLNPLTTVYGRVGLLHSFQADSGLELSAFGIPSFVPGQTVDVSDAWGAMLGMGVRLMPILRYELQLSGTFRSLTNVTFQNPGFNRSTRVSSTQLMNNLYLDIAPFFANGLWGFNPYVFGGVGITWNSTGDVALLGTTSPGSGVTRTLFAWNVGVGLQWQVMRNLILDVGYRYLDAGTFRTITTPPLNATALRFDNASHQIMFSLVVPVDGLIRGFGN